MRKPRNKSRLAAVLSMALALMLFVQPMIITAQAAAGEGGIINHAPGAPTGLLTNESEHPMNVESAPMFDWWVTDEDLDEVQTAYQIRLYDGITGALVWDSGKVASSVQNCAPYTGDPLKEGYPYSWEVRTWDSFGAVSPYSERAEFATGIGNGNWDANWILGIKEDSESPLSIVEEEVEDTLLVGEGFALQKEYTAWSNYEVTASFTLISGGVGLAFRASLDMKSGYVWQLVPGVGILRNKVVNGNLTALGEAIPADIVSGKTYTVSVKTEGDKIITTLDGAKIDEYTDGAPITDGTFGFFSERGCKTRLASLSASQSPVKQLTFTTGIARYDDGYSWTDYTLELDMVIHNSEAGITLRCPDGAKGYMWQFNIAKGGLARHIQKGASSFTKLDGNGAIPCSLTKDAKHHVKISVFGNTITTYLDGVLVNTYTDANATYTSGTFGIRQGSGHNVTLSNIKVTAPDGSILCRDEADDTANYTSARAITVSEGSDEGYTASFSEADLASWVGEGDTLPIKTGTQKVYWAESKGDGVTLLNYGAEWTDYTLSLDVQVLATSAGIVFRAPDAANSGYMWAVRSDGKLRLHKGVNNKYSRIGTNAESDISRGFVAGETYHIVIKVAGDTISTYIDGVHVNTRTSDISFGGSIGFRTDSSECGRYTNVVVTAPDGKILYADDFSGGAGSWGTSGALNADNSYWYSRKEVKLDYGKQVKKAIAYVSGSQDYELSVNGVRIGRAQTFDYPGETRYQGWDITDAVVGNDRMAIGVLTAYYGGGQGRAVSKPGLLGRFVVYYTDGTSTTVVTDESWLTHDTAYSNLGKRNGEGEEIEYCDGRLMLDGWSEVGYDTTGWVPVMVHGAHPTTTFYNLIPDLSRVAESRVSAVSVTKLEDGTTVADFGKVIPARVVIHFPSGVEGTVITVQEGYELLTSGAINTSTDSTQSTNMTYFYTMKGGEETFEAWNHLAFRYVSVPAEAGDLTAEDFEAVVLHAEPVLGRESTLDTSDDMLDQVFELMKRSALYSVQNQFVDTPTREKGQFLYDTINISAATTSGYYERQMTRKAILQFLASSDRLWSSESGSGVYNAVYPSNDGARDIPEFTLSVPVFVWRYYLMTGDRELLEYAYPYMVKTAGYVTRNTNAETGLVTAIAGGTSSSYKQGIIDTPPDRFGYDWSGTLDGVRTTINAHCVRLYDVVAEMSAELGYVADEALYSGKADDLRGAMNEYLVNDDGLYCDGLTKDGVQSANTSQHANSHAIMAGVPSDTELDGMADYIAGLGMKQGTMTADILMEALFESGQDEAAIRLLTNTKDYGWAKIIARGDTFIWENWHRNGSLSHGWGSASLLQVIEYISGVKIVEAGAKTIRINPADGGLNSVVSHTVTARGAVDISYSGSGKDYVITVDIPANMTAELVFPVLVGGRFVEIGGKNGTSEFVGDSQIITVGSGKRSFAFSNESGGGSDITSPAITAASLTIGTDLAINYKVSLPAGYDADALAMRFTMNGNVTTVSHASATQDYSVFTLREIAPQCMGDSITAELLLSGNVINRYDGYSVRACAESLLLDYPDDEHLKSLVTDMLNYGAAAQEYVGYKTDALVNAGLGGASTDAVPTVSDKANSITKSSNEFYGFTAAGVRFDCANKLYVKFKVSGGAPDTDAVSVTAGGKEIEIISLGGGEYVAYSENISALQFASVYTFELKVNGSTVQTLTYSVNSYAYAKYGDDTAMGRLALALYRYGVSSVAYRDNK